MYGSPHIRDSLSCSSTSVALYGDPWYICCLRTTPLPKQKDEVQLEDITLAYYLMVRPSRQLDDLKVRQPTRHRWLIAQIIRPSDEARHSGLPVHSSSTDVVEHTAICFCTSFVIGLGSGFFRPSFCGCSKRERLNEYGVIKIQTLEGGNRCSSFGEAVQASFVCETDYVAVV